MSSRAETLFKKFENLNVLIVGDVMIDRYLIGKVSRISPEAPVPVVDLVRSEDRLGGAANVALNIKALGATPWLFSVIGKDTEGVHFLRLMTEANLQTRGIVQIKDRPTTLKSRIMAGTQQMMRLDSETTEDLKEGDARSFLEKIRNFLDIKKVDIIVFQDYNKGVLSERVIREVMLEAIKRDIPTVVDPKKKNFLAYRKATIFKPNLKEIRESAPFDIKITAESLEKAAEWLRETLDCTKTMITLSEKGIFLSTKNSEEKGKIYPTQQRNIYDVCGAGDTVVSVATLALASNATDADIALLSNLAGSQVCEYVGVVPVNLTQLKAEYAREVAE